MSLALVAAQSCSTEALQRPDDLPDRAGPRRTLIRDAALVISMDPSLGRGPLGLIEGGDVLLDGEVIAAVGADLEDEGAEVVDATGRIVMPGFVDTHNHLWQSLIRGCGAGHELGGWIEACLLPLGSSALTPSRAETYAAVRLSTVDLIETGVTTVVDWSHAPDREFVRGNLDALADSGRDGRRHQ